MITNFFKRVEKEDSAIEGPVSKKTRTDIENSFSENISKEKEKCFQVASAFKKNFKLQKFIDLISHLQNVPGDIAKFCNRVLTQEEKYDLLMNVWSPDKNFVFPKSGDRRLRFKMVWLQTFDWLAYSPSEDGAFCRFCVLFASKHIGKSSQAPNTFVQVSFRNWKNAIEKYKAHQLKQYHCQAVESAASFTSIYEGKAVDVAAQIDEGRQKIIKDNRKKLIPIVQAIILCGRQNLALRGNVDAGPLSIP